MWSPFLFSEFVTTFYKHLKFNVNVNLIHTRDTGQTCVKFVRHLLWSGSVWANNFSLPGPQMFILTLCC